MNRRKVGAVHEIDRASASDLVTLATDRGQVPMNIGAVLIIDRAELDLRDVRTTVAQRLPRVPRLRRRHLPHTSVAGGRCGWMTPSSTWTRHICPPSHCLRQHTQQTVVSRPTTSCCCRLLTRLVCTPLDHDRPLWAARWVAGLTQDRRLLSSWSCTTS